MHTLITQQDPLSVVTLRQAKSQLNIIDFDDDDEHIQLLIDAASELAEGYTNRMLSTGTVKATIDYSHSFYLPYGEVSEETSLITVVANGFGIDFEFDEVSQKITITDSSVSLGDKVTVTYLAGYSEVPNAAKMGVLMLVSSLYNNREDSITGLTVADIPLDSIKILDRIKIDGA